MKIHTIESRDNVMFTALKNYASLSPEIMSFSIIEFFNDFLNHINKAFDYEKLKYSLVPNKDKKEYLFVFDISLLKTFNYGDTALSKILPHLDRKKPHNILTGDYLDLTHGKAPVKVLNILFDYMKIDNEKRKYIVNGLYCIYINNLSEEDVYAITSNLSKIESIIGYADMTYSSLLKTYLRRTIGTRYVLHDGLAITGHEPDIDEISDRCISSDMLESMGYKVLSIRGDYFDIFLKYMISSDVIVWEESEYQHLMSNVITKSNDLVDKPLKVTQDKLTYVENSKKTMTRLGLAEEDVDKIEELIFDKIKNSVVYNIDLSLINEYHIVKFDVIFDFISQTKCDKFTCALKYSIDEDSLSIITFY
ncbi:MAG: hypothetical protein AB1414_00710 [bacterium]